VAEDDHGLARVFGRALRRAGYEVVWAADATQALQVFEQQAAPFSAVLLDLDMADTGIHNAHAAMRSRNRELPIILLTGLPEPESGPPFKAAPTHDVILRKPVDPAVLARVISMAIRRSGRLSRL
jgi:CheY-like chemotaxis protein